MDLPRERDVLRHEFLRISETWQIVPIPMLAQYMMFCKIQYESDAGTDGEKAVLAVCLISIGIHTSKVHAGKWRTTNQPYLRMTDDYSTSD